MLYSNVVAASSALLICIAQASVTPPSNTYWSRTERGAHNDEDNDEADLETLQEALSGWERRPARSSGLHPRAGLASSSRLSSSSNNKRRGSNEDDVDFKRSQDWWKDPLAQFDGVDSRGSREMAPSKKDDDYVLNDDEPESIMEEDDFTLNVQPVRTKAPLPVIEEQNDETEVITPRPRKTQRGSFETPKETIQASPESRVNHQVAIQEESRQGSSFGFPVLLASLIPGPAKQLLSRIPVMQVLALLAVAKQLYEWRMQQPLKVIKSVAKAEKSPAARKKTNKAVENKPIRPETTRMDHLDLDSESDEELDLDEVPEAFRNNPRTRAVFEKKKKRANAAQAAAVPEPKAEVVKPRKVAPAKPAKKRVTSKSQTKMMPVLSGGWTDGLFGPRRPSARQLMEKVTSLEQSFQQAEQAKSNLEQAYERANWQLQESQTEFDKLKQTTKYLQAQLRDNEEMLEKVVKEQEHKSTEELMQMKEAMIKVVEREREAMREEFIKQAAELEEVWKLSVGKRRHSSRTRSSVDDAKSNVYSVE
ncbi:hypothetical protein MPSEU_001034300 [Mayamaea pseudoterrestris]|nr:hypothetical protein MPSEU_001034300 [Mayamaea pseudoterrestris]